MANIKGKIEKLEQKVIKKVDFGYPISFLRDLDQNIQKKAKNIVILTSKKHFSTAVSRNRARRLAREAIRVSAKALEIPLSQIKLIVNVQKPILKVKFDDLVKVISKEIKKIHK